jgi:ubiquinone/menaquinone biosynthesis C-methylase UbiE
MPQRNHSELASTYFVHEFNEKELARLILQDRLLTTQMGGILSEQPDPARFQSVLDVACGPADWLLESSKEYPNRRGIGIDISNRVIQYAREQAEVHHMTDRVEFHVMDALSGLAFPDASFDLVNLRLGMSFIRTWEWLKLLVEMRRVTCSGGIIRLTEAEVLPVSSGAALTRLGQIFLCAFDRAGRLFEPNCTGVTDHLVPLLQRVGYRQVRQQTFPLVLKGRTEAGQLYAENIEVLLKTARPFLEKWGGNFKNYDTLSEQVVREMQADFHVTWTLHTIWGIV